MAARRYYPIFVNLEGRLAVVIGDHHEAAIRAQALLDSGARVRVVSPAPDEAVRSLASTGGIELFERELRASDLAGATLAIACGDERSNEAARAAATAERVPLNVLDVPKLCDWIHGSVVRRDQLVIAISTSGAAPALAVRIKERLVADYGPEYGRFLELASEHREAIAKSGLSFAQRRTVWYRIADSQALAAVRDGDDARARAIFAAELAAGLAEAAATGSP